ncbi:MAG: DNA adenine methylase [Bryobacteraceae bacterium]|nr:DNA adenine methylase [Bryobacteraceae bacterium]
MRILQSETSVPLMAYYGGKGHHVDWINEYLPRSAAAYIEAFTGSAAVGLARPKAKIEVFNDLDPGVANLYRVIQTDADELQLRLNFTLNARAEHDLCDIAEEARIRGAGESDDVEWARQHLVLIRQSFSGIFNGSWGYTRQSKSQSFHRVVDRIGPVAHRLRGATIENLHFADLIRKYEKLGPDVAWYLDPPYVPATRVSAQVYRCEMTLHEHELLLSMITGLSGMVVLSGYPSELYDVALKGWMRATKSVACYASGHPRHAGMPIKPRRTECLWINPAAQDRLRQEHRLAE